MIGRKGAFLSIHDLGEITFLMGTSLVVT